MTKEQIVLVVAVLLAGWGVTGRLGQLGGLPPLDDLPPEEGPRSVEAGVPMPRLAEPGSTVGEDPLEPIDVWRVPRPAPLGVPPDIEPGPGFPAGYWDDVRAPGVHRIPELPEPVPEGGTE